MRDSERLMSKQVDESSQLLGPDADPSHGHAHENAEASKRVLDELQTLAFTFGVQARDVKVDVQQGRTWFGLGQGEYLQAEGIEVLDRQTGDTVSIPGSFRLERSGDEEHVRYDFPPMSMDIYANRANGTMEFHLNDTTIHLDGRGNVDMQMSDRRLQLKSDGAYEEQRPDGSRVMVSKLGVVTNTDSQGVSSHFRLAAEGAAGAKLLSFSQDATSGELLTHFSDGTTRTLHQDLNSRIVSSWTSKSTGVDGKESIVQKSETLDVDSFAREHLLSRIYLSRTLTAPMVSGSSAVFRWDQDSRP